MPVATMTSKGQLTVPKEVRDALGLRAGTRVEFVKGEESWIFKPISGRPLSDLSGLIEYDGPVRSLDDMDEAISSGFAASADVDKS